MGWTFSIRVTSDLMWNMSVVPHCLQDKAYSPSPPWPISPFIVFHLSLTSSYTPLLTFRQAPVTLNYLQFPDLWAFVYDAFSFWNSMLSLLTFIQLASGTCLLKGPQISPVCAHCPSIPFPKHPTRLFIIAFLMLYHDCLLVNFPHSFIHSFKHFADIQGTFTTRQPLF